MSLKSSEELCAMTMKNGAKFGKGLSYHFKIDFGEFEKF